MAKQPYWIKERHNPQLGTYYVGMGQLSKAAAKRYEAPLYGDNVMHRFDSEADYNKRLAALRQSGASVQ